MRSIPLLALFAIAGALAIAPASAAAMDDQSTGTGSNCVERAPGVFLDSAGEPCEPLTLPGETINLSGTAPSAPPAPAPKPCSALSHKCGLPEEGRVPRQPPDSSEKGLGGGQGRGRGAGAAAKDPKQKEDPNAHREAKVRECQDLQNRILDALPGSTPEVRSFQDRIKEDEGTIEFQRSLISGFIRELFTKRDSRPNPFTSGIKNISQAQARIWELESKIKSLRSELDIAAKRALREKFAKKSCSSILNGF